MAQGSGPYPEAEDSVSISLEQKRAEKEELESFLADVQAGTDPEWEAVQVPAWKNRTVWVRSLTSGERARLRREGYRQVKNDQGEPYLQETGELEPLLVEMAVYVEIGGKKQKLFKPTPESRALIKRQRGGGLDELIATALRLSGMTKKAEEEAQKDFLKDPQNPGSDSDWPEISE